jgi:hypothetical protein
MHHPLVFVPPEKRKPLFFTFLALTFILFAVFRVLDQPLRTSAAPNGIVSYELAGSPAGAESILASWDARAQIFAAFGLGIDYLFMPAYSLALALGVLLAAGKFKGLMKSLGAAAGWGAVGAALFDAVENYALWRILIGEITSPYPEIAALCASVKFFLLAFGILYGLAGWILPRRP